MLTTTHVLEMTRTSVTQLYLPLIATAGEPATSAAVKTGVIWWHALNQELRRVGWCVLNVTKSAWSRLSGWKYHCKLLQLRRQTRLSKRHVICNDIKSSRTSWPRGQKFRPRPWTRPRRIVLRLGPGMPSNFLFWPRENECNDGTGNHCEFAMIIYQSCLLTYLVLLI